MSGMPKYSYFCDPARQELAGHILVEVQPCVTIFVFSRGDPTFTPDILLGVMDASCYRQDQ